MTYFLPQAMQLPREGPECAHGPRRGGPVLLRSDAGDAVGVDDDAAVPPAGKQGHDKDGQRRRRREER